MSLCSLRPMGFGKKCQALAVPNFVLSLWLWLCVDGLIMCLRDMSPQCGGDWDDVGLSRTSREASLTA